jgi:hypothetical protein
MSALQDIVSYILGNHPDLGFSPDRKKWVTQLRERSEALNCQIAEGTIRSILTGSHGMTRDDVLNNLATIFRKKPIPRYDPASGEIIKDAWDFADYAAFRALSILQFRLPSLEVFRQWEKRESSGPDAAEQERLTAAAKPGRILRNYQFVAKTYPDTPLGRYEMVIPVTRRSIPLTGEKDELHYVTWRYALESGPKQPKIAREVLTFKCVNEMHHATMSYKLGNDDSGKVIRLFEGPVAFLGRSHMCVMVAVEETSEGWEADFYRGRVMFIRRVTSETSFVARFGLMASTRADGDFEPSAACTIMMLAEGEIADIQEFRRLVTLVRPADEILKRDFGGLPEHDLKLIESFLDNVPAAFRIPADRGIGEAGGDEAHDMVLRLHLGRFNENMPRIRTWMLDPENGIKNPIIKDWKSEGVLLARE